MLRRIVARVALCKKLSAGTWLVVNRGTMTEHSSNSWFPPNLLPTFKSLGVQINAGAEERQIAGAVDGETSTFLVGTAIAGAIFIGYYVLLAVIAATRRSVLSRDPYPASRDTHLAASLHSALHNFRKD